MKFRYLSNILKDINPAYGGEGQVSLRRLKSIAAGDSANTYELTFANHLGTHIDAPNHFFEDGKKIADYPAGSWIFRNPGVVKVGLKPSEILKCGKWIERIGPKADILIIRSGWSEMRQDKRYGTQNPGIDPQVAIALRKRYPGLRAVGIDWVSVSPFTDRALGRETHKAFLDPNGENNPVAIIEDMDLSSGLEGLREVFVAPLRVEDIDSAPCTVIGGFLD